MFADLSKYRHPNNVYRFPTEARLQLGRKVAYYGVNQAFEATH